MTCSAHVVLIATGCSFYGMQTGDYRRVAMTEFTYARVSFWHMHTPPSSSALFTVTIVRFIVRYSHEFRVFTFQHIQQLRRRRRSIGTLRTLALNGVRYRMVQVRSYHWQAFVDHLKLVKGGQDRRRSTVMAVL